MDIDKEKAIRIIVQASVTAYAAGFSDRHISEKDDPEGTINMKIHNVLLLRLVLKYNIIPLCRDLWTAVLEICLRRWPLASPS